MNVDLLKRLCETPGIPGREERVRALIELEVKGLFDEVRTDPMGSLICVRKPTRKPVKGAAPLRVMLACHMDEIGFYVRHIDDKGYLWLNPAGGFDARNLFSRRVLVCSEENDLVGVMNPGGKPIHISSPEDRKKIPEVTEFYIDLGMSPDDVRNQVRIGDMVVMHEPFAELGDTLVSKAMDNRVACWLGIESVRQVAGRGKGKASAKGVDHACEIHCVFTVQEEVGLRGAVTSAYTVKPDVGIGIDTTLCCDTPGVPENDRVTKQGDGVAITVMDGSVISTHALVNQFEEIAKKRKIPHQRSILGRGGTDTAALQKAGSGAKAITISVGTRYIHTVTEMVHRGDLEAARNLLAAYLEVA